MGGPHRGYQLRFSESQREEMYDVAARRTKARKALAILADHVGDLSSCALLDLGCSTGIMTAAYAERCRTAIGIDVDEPGVHWAIENMKAPNLEFRVGDAMATGLADASVELVTCTHTYEHVPDSRRLMDEIYRVLKPGGVCLFAAGNRLIWMESDNHLPLLSVLPRWLANWYVRIAGRGDGYYERTMTVWALRRMVGRFEVIDYTARVIAAPERFQSSDIVVAGSRRQRIALLGLRFAYWLSPTFLWLLKKPVAA